MLPWSRSLVKECLESITPTVLHKQNHALEDRQPNRNFRVQSLEDGSHLEATTIDPAHSETPTQHPCGLAVGRKISGCIHPTNNRLQKLPSSTVTSPNRKRNAVISIEATGLGDSPVLLQQNSTRSSPSNGPYHTEIDQSQNERSSILRDGSTSQEYLHHTPAQTPPAIAQENEEHTEALYHKSSSEQTVSLRSSIARYVNKHNYCRCTACKNRLPLSNKRVLSSLTQGSRPDSQDLANRTQEFLNSEPHNDKLSNRSQDSDIGNFSPERPLSFNSSQSGTHATESSVEYVEYVQDLEIAIIESSHDARFASKEEILPPLILSRTEDGQRKDGKPSKPIKKLLHWQILLYRAIFITAIVSLNVSLLLVYLFTPRHHYVLAFLVFMKSKDMLSTIAGIFGTLWSLIHDMFYESDDIDPTWVMSLVCAYAETEGQIMKTITSLLEQNLGSHKQVICIILDGKPKEILPHFTRVVHTSTHSYTTWKMIKGDLSICAGFMRDTPVLLIQKVKNAGKKDTLILGHSLFNYNRTDAPMDIQQLRYEIWTRLLPTLLGHEDLKSFDYIYATDADSTIHKDCLRELANALIKKPKAIAACGIILAELGTSEEWSVWHLFQQFQYAFGQHIRRQAESLWGRVTCLPGPVTMVKVRPEMAKAISDYAAPITSANLFLHQVQYQGTDRRLTYCINSQNKDLQTILVTRAIGETVVPTTISHYLSQRRRWAANAYFNDYAYAFGPQQRLVTRVFAIVDIIRMSFVYYRVMNTILFIKSLSHSFQVLKIIPTLILTKSPAVWFFFLVMAKEPVLRKRVHKLILGSALNQIISPISSIVIFSKMLLSLGNYAWGMTGVSSKTMNVTRQPPMTEPNLDEPSDPRLIKIIKSVIHPTIP